MYFVALIVYTKMVLFVDDRQEYDVRDERRRELEFLEKVWNLIILHLRSSFMLRKFR